MRPLAEIFNTSRLKMPYDGPLKTGSHSTRNQEVAMSIHTASMTVVTENLPETRSFYENHFNARAVFDCGWYVVLRLSPDEAGPELCLKELQNGEKPYNGGVVLNIEVDDVNTIHRQITGKGLLPVMPLEDHPWGDRGFGVLDPSGVMVYCYHPIEPAPEFEPYFVKEG